MKKRKAEREREREAAAGETRSGGRKSQTSNRQFRPPYEHAACLNKNQPDLRSTSTLVSRDCTDVLPCYRALEYERNFHNCTSIFFFFLTSLKWIVVTYFSQYEELDVEVVIREYIYENCSMLYLLHGIILCVKLKFRIFKKIKIKEYFFLRNNCFKLYTDVILNIFLNIFFYFYFHGIIYPSY